MVKIIVIAIVAILALTACSAPKDGTAGTTMNEVWYAEVRPDSQIINGDVYMALLEAAMASNAPLTADEVSEIVGAFGFDLSQLSEISGGRFTERDVTHGRMTSDRAKKAMAAYEILREAYALNLSAYMKENGIEDDATMEEVVEWFRQSERTSGEN